MLAIKGFVSINQYVNNTPGQTSLLGELSTWALTYSKEHGEYQHSSMPEYQLTTFKSVDAVSGFPVLVPDTLTVEILELVQASVLYAQNNIRPYVTPTFINYLLAEFNGRITGLELGDWVDNGHIALPSWVLWNSNDHDSTTIKIWLSNEAFVNQYDDYEVIVIPPIDNLDELFGFYNVAVTAISQVSISDLLTRIEDAKQSYPETFLRVNQFDYVNRLNTLQRTVTNWGIVIYGKAGDNIDVIKDSLAEYILTHSTHTEAEWSVVLPDIFKRTEFMILPRWDHIAIPNLTVAAAIYSSIINPVEAVEFAIANVPGYPPTWIEDNISIIPYDYKAIMLQVINGVDNTVGQQSISDQFPDYIPVSSTTLDFNRMSIDTREWVLLMEQLLITAETATEFTSIPARLRRFKRQNMLFVSVVYNNINYLMAAKSNSCYQ